jgi:demethylmenaquinone methyltransferase/2-methoxy-6-polyprenyl-1,4-benzoquinol methylase
VSRGSRVFTRIAGRYDLLNRILSLGRDGAWRRSAIRLLPPGRVLDLGAGTGAANPEFGGRAVIALDPAPQMLSLNAAPDRVVAMGEALPFEDGCFDGVFSAFVFRNLESIPDTLAEIHRVLRPGGAAAVVGLSRPASPTKRAVHRMGTAVALPVAGAIVGAPREYWYLHRSLDNLPQPQDLFAGGPLAVERLWRMGPLGFVYGVVLRR